MMRARGCALAVEGAGGRRLGAGVDKRSMDIAGTWIAETDAQATVEMAVVVPVLLIVALIVYNIMLFVSATARFDRVAPDIVIAQGVAPSSAEDANILDASETIREQLAGAMEGYGVEVEVARVEEDFSGGAFMSLVGGLRTYRCTMRMRPWPSSLSIAGVDLGAPLELSHAREVTVDPWRPGVVM